MAVATLTSDAALPGRLHLTGCQVGYHLRLLVRSPRSLLAGVLLPVVILLMHGIHGSPAAQSQLVAGLAVLGALSTSYVTHTNSLVIARESGVLRRWQVNPVPAACFFAGKIVATVLTALASALTTLACSLLLGATTSPTAVAALLVPLAIGSLVWSLLGTAVSGFIPNAASAYPLLTLTYLPVAVVSGAVGPTTGQPTWLQTLAGYLPVQPVLDAADQAMHQHSLVALGDPRAGLTLLGWAAAAGAVALLAFRWSPARA